MTKVLLSAMPLRTVLHLLLPTTTVLFPLQCLSILMGIVIALNIVVTSIDPCDPNIRDKLRNRIPPEFDRSKHAHVITENFFCNICEEQV